MKLRKDGHRHTVHLTAEEALKLAAELIQTALCAQRFGYHHTSNGVEVEIGKKVSVGVLSYTVYKNAIDDPTV